MPPLFDAHCHLPDGGEGPPDRLRVVCGTGPADWGAVLAHAAGDALVIPMLGLHPWRLVDTPADWPERLEDLLGARPRVGVGECGLDFARQSADRSGQEAALRIQLRLAHALHRPVALHAVQAWGALLAILREEGVPPAGAMVHAFGGSAETARDLQAMGVFLSFSDGILDPARARLREALAAVAPDRLLLESDDSADLLRVLQGAAAVRGISPRDLARLTWENGHRCFKELMA